MSCGTESSYERHRIVYVKSMPRKTGTPTVLAT